MSKPVLMMMNRYGDENAELRYSSLLISGEELDKALAAAGDLAQGQARDAALARRFEKLWEEAWQAGKRLGLEDGFLLTCLRGGVFRDCGEFWLFAPIANYWQGPAKNPKARGVAQEDEAFADMFFGMVAKEWGAAGQREDFGHPRNWLAEPVERYIGLARRRWAQGMAMHERARLSEAAGMAAPAARRRGV